MTNNGKKDHEKELKEQLQLEAEKNELYETMTHLYFDMKKNRNDLVVFCSLRIGKKVLEFKWSAAASRDTAVEYTPLRLLEDGVEVDMTTKMQGYNKPIRFEEESSPKFLQRLIKTLE